MHGIELAILWDLVLNFIATESPWSASEEGQRLQCLVHSNNRAHGDTSARVCRRVRTRGRPRSPDPTLTVRPVPSGGKQGDAERALAVRIEPLERRARVCAIYAIVAGLRRLLYRVLASFIFSGWFYCPASSAGGRRSCSSEAERPMFLSFILFYYSYLLLLRSLALIRRLLSCRCPVVHSRVCAERRVQGAFLSCVIRIARVCGDLLRV